MTNQTEALTPSRRDLLLAEDNSQTCCNCTVELQGRYCHGCGQPVRPLDPTFHDLWHEAAHEFLHIDGKIWRSLKLLALRPGALTDDFLHGRRARHIGPFRLYLTISLVFFFLLFHAPEKAKQNIIAVNGDSVAAQTVPGKAKDAAAGRDDDDSEARTRAGGDSKEASPAPGDGSAPTSTSAGAEKEKAQIKLGDDQLSEKWTHKIQNSLQKAQSNPEEFKHETLEGASHAMFFMLPIFALLLRVLYRKSGLHYPACLYFSIHFHAFFFLILSFSFLLTICTFGRLTIPSEILWLIGLVYLHIALRRVYGGSGKGTAWTICKLLLAYLPMLGIALAGTAVSALLF